MALSVIGEQIGGLINLHLWLVGPTQRIPTGNPNRRVGKKQSDRVVKTRKSIGSRGRKNISDRVIQISIQTRRVVVLIIQRSAERQHFAGGENHRIHLNTGLAHVRPKVPDRHGLRQIDDLGGLGRRIGAAHDHYAGRIVVSGCERQQHAGSIAPRAAVFCLCNVLSPCLVAGIKDRRVRAWRRIKNLAIGKLRHTRIEWRSPRSIERRTPSRSSCVKLHCTGGAAVFIQTRECKHAAITEHGGRGIPASDGHRLHVCKEVGCGVVHGGARLSVKRIVLHCAAGDQRSSIREDRHPVAKHVP